jgi:hypothetical protein
MRSDYRYECRSCFSKKGNQWASDNPDASARHKRSHHLRKKFGITIDEQDAILTAQGGRCAICRMELLDSKTLHVDHDHATNRIRGVLCIRCNVGLGSFKDNPDLLIAASDYLRSHHHEGVNSHSTLGEPYGK